MPSITRRHYFLAAIVLLVLAGLVHAFWPKPDKAGKEKQAVPVKVAKAVAQDYPLTLVTVGRVQPSETVTMRARVDGQVRQVLMKEGGNVRSGDILLTLDDAEFKTRLVQAEAILARDEAQLANARTELARNETLKEKNYVSDDMLRASRTNVASLAATVKGDKAAVDNARLQLSYTVLRAPFDGRVGARLVFPGTAVKTNDTILAVINRVHPVQVAFAVPEKFLGQLQALRSGGRMPVTVGSDSDSTLNVSGNADFIDNTVDTTSGTIQVKATFPNTDDRLTAGAFVKVRLDLDLLKDAVIIPLAALQQNGDESSVYVMTADNKAELRKVAVRDSRDDIAAIASGLKTGETVITDGLLRLTPGASVKVQEEKTAAAKTETAQGK